MNKRILITKLSVCAFAVCLVLVASLQGKAKHTPASRSPQNADMRVFVTAMSSLVKRAQAGEEGDSTCNAISEAAWEKVRDSASKYDHGALQFFNSMFAMLNAGFPSETENALCHFARSMEMNPDKSGLPVTISKTFSSKTVVLEVVVPTEEFAVAAGYDAKGTVTVNDEKMMVLYWGGTADATKGFMIRGTADIGGGLDKKNMHYIRWDRSTEDQTVDFWGARFDETYLESFTAGSGQDKSKSRTFYGHTAYNKTTKEVLTYAVEIGPTRDGNSTYGCFRIWATGTFDGEMTIAKTDNAHGMTGHAVTYSDVLGLQMDAAVLENSTDTVNGTGNLSGGQFTTTVTPLIAANPFGKSCNDINNGSATGQPFENSEANFELTPDDIF